MDNALFKRFQKYYNMTELTTFRAPSKQQHPLKIQFTIPLHEEILDEKTNYRFMVVEHPILCDGSGCNRGNGLMVLDDIPAKTVFAITKEPSIVMDLKKYSKAEYIDNGYIVIGESRASTSQDLVMFANTIAPITASKVEIPNCKFMPPKQLKKGPLRDDNPKGLYAYLKSTRAIKAKTMVLVDNYGKGSNCLSFGQKSTINKQQRRIKLYQENKKLIKEMKQKGNDVCEFCSQILPRYENKKRAHRLKCNK